MCYILSTSAEERSSAFAAPGPPENAFLCRAPAICYSYTLCRYMIEDAADAWEELRSVCRLRFVQGFTQLVQSNQCTTVVEVKCATNYERTIV